MPRVSLPVVDSAAAVGAAAQIRRHFALLIADGRLAPGERLPAVRVVAAASRVSINTVRAAYSRLEADGLVTTRQGVGTTVLPVMLAALAGAGSEQLGPGTLGVILAGLDPFYLPILEGIVATAHLAGVVTLTATAENEPERAALAIRQMAARGIGGFIVLSADIGLAAPGELPIVHVDCPGRAGYGIDLDAVEGGRVLGGHLSGHGHQRVGLVTAPACWPNMAGLLEGVRGAARDAGMTLVVSEVPGFRAEHGRRGLAGLLDRADPPTAVVAAGAMLALGVIEEATGRGLRIPGDLAIVGYADAAPARFASPPVTMAGFAERSIGAAAATMALDLVAGRRVSPRRRVAAVDLRVRASCGCTAG